MAASQAVPCILFMRPLPWRAALAGRGGYGQTTDLHAVVVVKSWLHAAFKLVRGLIPYLIQDPASIAECSRNTTDL